tara:strand:- start:32 stop:232 length:201 start_codon:yes stop_codon:yes gene_type:complete
MNLETEIPETLFNEMKGFIDSNPQLNQSIFISAALTNFLFQNGCEDRSVLENYLNDVFDQSPSYSD